MKIAGAILLSIASITARAQPMDRPLHFDLRSDDHVLVLGADEPNVNGGTLRVTAFKFYVGHFTALHKGEVIWTDDSYHLIDASDPGSHFIHVPDKGPIDVLSFVLGVDSLTNVSGALGGDLDPTKGMYWTWNSGYINVKLEGSSSSRGTREGQFEFHLGGYMPPHLSAQPVTVLVRKEGPIEVKVDLAEFFERVDVRTEPNVMSPSERAVFLSELAARMFSCDEDRP
jgi:hypothetical protein